jgi:hypothetical protein
MRFIMRHVLNYISLQRVCYRVRVTRRVKKPARVRVWVRTCNLTRAWVFYRVELELAGAGMERHYPMGFYLLPSLSAGRMVA